ncbi:MAG: 3-deoxy-D-manno-octulosonic acid transferase, partial [Paracoccaceae bacterium]
MGFSPSLTLYHFLGPIIARGLEHPQPKANSTARPPGKLLWLHAPRRGDLAALKELVAQLADRDPDLWFLFTTHGAAPNDIPDQCIHAILPADSQTEMREFIDHWKPDILVWVTGELYPALTHIVASQAVPLILIDTGAAFEASRGWRMLPGLNRRTLRKFGTILSGDEATSLALISAGADSKNVRTIGVLEQGITPLPCNEVEWMALAALLATRPLWFAAEIDLAELG